MSECLTWIKEVLLVQQKSYRITNTKLNMLVMVQLLYKTYIVSWTYNFMGPKQCRSRYVMLLCFGKISFVSHFCFPLKQENIAFCSCPETRHNRIENQQRVCAKLKAFLLVRKTQFVFLRFLQDSCRLLHELTLHLSLLSCSCKNHCAWMCHHN